MKEFLFAFCWLAVTGLVSIDYFERLSKKDEWWRKVAGFIVLLVGGVYIALGGVLSEMMDAIIDDDEGDGADVH